MAEKLLVLNLQRLRNLQFFLSFSYYNFEDTLTNFEKDTFRKAFLTCKQNLNVQFSVIYLKSFTILSLPCNFCIFRGAISYS